MVSRICQALTGTALLIFLVTSLDLVSLTTGQAQTGTEFPGTVLTVEQTTGKFAVKKDTGGTRFTFVATDKTKFQGAGLASLKDLRKDDKVVVLYHAQGPQYVAISVTKR